MSTVNQIFNIVNDVAKQTFGEKAISVVDTSTLVALGDEVLRSDENTVKISSLESLLSFFVLDRIKPEYGENYTSKYCTDENKKKGIKNS